MCVQRGELPYLIELLKKDPTGVNACDEVRREGSSFLPGPSLACV